MADRTGGRDGASASGRCLGRLAAVAALALALVSTALPAAAGGQRQPPPEASRDLFVGPEAIAELETAIAIYESIVSAGGWPLLPERTTLRPGDNDAAVAILRRRLAASGDLAAGPIDGSLFDDGLAAAVRRFQARHGLEATGIVFGITLRTLNVPAETRLTQLRANLARLQELAGKVAAQPRYLLMNSASFELQGVANGQVEVASRTIAGKRKTPTPVVSAVVRAINLLPYWHVPQTIARAALVPAVRKDPAYLYKERIRVYSTFGGEEIDPATVNWWSPDSERYVFRQDPGPQNALGVMRFDMPNKHIVYMHDTPMKQLFGSFERAYSAGCVRVQGFLDLADWLLAGQDGWTRRRLEETIAAGTAKTISLARPVPVHFVYLTAWVDRGVTQFRNDLYNRDEAAGGEGEDTTTRVLVQSIAP